MLIFSFGSPQYFEASAHRSWDVVTHETLMPGDVRVVDAHGTRPHLTAASVFSKGFGKVPQHQDKTTFCTGILKNLTGISPDSRKIMKLLYCCPQNQEFYSSDQRLWSVAQSARLSCSPLLNTSSQWSSCRGYYLLNFERLQNNIYLFPPYFSI